MQLILAFLKSCHLFVPSPAGNQCSSPLSSLYLVTILFTIGKKNSQKALCVYPDEIVRKHFRAPKASSTLARCEELAGAGWGGELAQLIAHPLAPFVSPLPGSGQGWWQMICLLHCQTLCSPLESKQTSRRLQEASTREVSREVLC